MSRQYHTTCSPSSKIIAKSEANDVPMQYLRRAS
jgi:hypothetical protein